MSQGERAKSTNELIIDGMPPYKRLQAIQAEARQREDITAMQAQELRKSSGATAYTTEKTITPLNTAFAAKKINTPPSPPTFATEKSI